MRRVTSRIVLIALALGACSTATGREVTTRASGPDPGRSPVATASPDDDAAAAPAPTTAPPPPARVVAETAWAPFATVGELTLVHPSARVERIGFHQANHDGARELVPTPSAAAPVTLEARERGTASRTAADVVVDPAAEIRAPVTGRIKRGGTYTLYCKYTDSFAVIAPDARPDWEVKILHMNGLRVRPGDRVVAGQTVLAAGPTQLPFESQVDEIRTLDPAWPHVHVEVVDPSIKDRPNPGSGC